MGLCRATTQMSGPRHSGDVRSRPIADIRAGIDTVGLNLWKWGGAMRNIRVLMALTLASACSPETQSADDILSTPPNAASAQQLDDDLRVFARRQGARLTASDFPGSPTKERAYRIFGEGYEIAVTEPFEEGQYRAYFYSTTGARGDPALIAVVRDRFRSEVLGPGRWHDG